MRKSIVTLSFRARRTISMFSFYFRRIIALKLLRISVDESQTIKELIYDVNGASVFIDAGANVGKVSRTISHSVSNKKLKIWAFEPDPVAFRELTLLKDKGIVAHNKALFNATGVATLYRHVDFKVTNTTTSSSLNSTKSNIGIGDSVEVETIRLSNFVQECQPNAIVMKLDIEGSEYEVIKDLLKTKEIDKFARIYCEFHPHKIRFGIMKHLLLLAKLILSGNLSRIRYWY